MFTSKIDSNHTIYHVHNAETANPVDWYLISGEGDCGEGDCGEGDCGEGDCGEGDCGEGDCGEGDCGEGEWIPMPLLTGA